MNEPSDVKHRQKQPAVNCSLDRNDLRKLASILQERSSAAAELEVSHFNPLNVEAAELERQRGILRDAFTLRFTVSGADGRELFGTIDQVFDSPNFPDEVTSFYVSSDTELKAIHNYAPRNSFILFLDFERPAVSDFRLLPALETPNGSNLQVEGYDATWVNGVFSEITNFFKERPAKFPIIHRHSIYEMLLYPIGIPFAFWVCSKASPAMGSALPESSFIHSAVYVYLFAASLFLFRILFHYLRWVAPVAEFRAPKSGLGTHRAILATLALGVFGSFLYDVARYLLGIGRGAG